jgi:acid stress-induced BolA-like protein IbaG/YrbA
MLSNERMRALLLGMGLRDARVHVEGGPWHLVAVLVSPEFEGVEEAERPARVRGYLYDRITDAERPAIEFVFTATPDEAAHLDEAL